MGTDTAAIDDELGSIVQSSKVIKDQGQAYELLARTFVAVVRINTAVSATPTDGVASPQAATQLPSPIDSLQGWIQKIRDALDALAIYLEATSYTIGVSLPIGLAVQVTFNV